MRRRVRRVVRLRLLRGVVELAHGSGAGRGARARAGGAALEHLPELSAAMRRGQVSYSKVRAVTRVATPETEQALLDVALAGTAALLRAYGSESDDSATGRAC